MMHASTSASGQALRTTRTVSLSAPLRPHRLVSPAVVVRSGGVQDLLARDRKPTNLAPELADLGSSPAAESKGQEAEQVVKTRRRRQENIAKAASSKADPDRPKSCKQAIDKGLQLFQDKQYQEAIDLFNLALELPGNGAYRLPDSPREYSCPSDAEEHAALYNMACAYAQMGRKDSVLTCLEAILENNFTDFETIRKDPDLKPAQGPELDVLLFKYENPVAKVATMLPFNLGQKKMKQSDTDKKPWLMW